MFEYYFAEMFPLSDFLIRPEIDGKIFFLSEDKVRVGEYVSGG